MHPMGARCSARSDPRRKGRGGVAGALRKNPAGVLVGEEWARGQTFFRVLRPKSPWGPSCAPEAAPSS